MTTDTATAKRSEYLLYLIGIVLSVPPLISIVQRQFAVPTAADIEQALMAYRSLSEAASKVVHAPLFGIGLPPPPPLSTCTSCLRRDGDDDARHAAARREVRLDGRMV